MLHFVGNVVVIRLTTVLLLSHSEQKRQKNFSIAELNVVARMAAKSPILSDARVYGLLHNFFLFYGLSYDVVRPFLPCVVCQQPS